MHRSQNSRTGETPDTGHAEDAGREAGDGERGADDAPAPPATGLPAKAEDAFPPRHRLIVALVAGLVAFGVLVHVAATFVHIAPQNVARDTYGPAARDYLYPEFRQHWSLFAPELPRNDTVVHARAVVRAADGGTETTEWTDLTAIDRAELRSGPLPSRTRHQLRKVWTEVLQLQAADGEVVGQRAADVRETATRIAVGRLPVPADAVVESIQFRTVTTPIPPPPWAAAPPPAEPSVRDHSWWPVEGAGPAGALSPEATDE
ncbi:MULTISPECIES: DUF5819 family protein [unclassified Streptomyces]|uniref:DUF5819 family protein n=1 Tax=unclassified Streptomyces TaxID=2593676 RepID=UPI000CD4BBFF|nr:MULTISPECIES: DUF5819 family protein [unclassified Streptomyces]